MATITRLEACPGCGIRWCESDEFYCGHCGASIQSLSIAFAGGGEALPLRFDGERMTHEGEFWLYPDDQGRAQGRFVFRRDRAQGVSLNEVIMDGVGSWGLESRTAHSDNMVEVAVRTKNRVERLGADGLDAHLGFSIGSILGQVKLRLLPPPSFSILALSPKGLGGSCGWDGKGRISVEFENPQEENEVVRFQVSPGSTALRLSGLSARVNDAEMSIDPEGAALPIRINGAEIELRVVSGGRELTSQRPIEIEVARNGFVDEGEIGTLELVLSPDFGLDPIVFEVYLNQARPFSVAFYIGADQVNSHRIEVVHEGSDEDFSIAVKNNGRETLEDLGFESSESWLRLTANDSNARSVLPPERTIQLTATIVGGHRSLLAKGGGSSTLSLCSGRREIGRFSVIVGEVRRRKIVQGYLGIDFGTTNTTCAFSSQSNPVPQCLPIRGEDLGTYSAHYPSAIAFIDLGNPERPVYVTGSRALVDVRSNGGGNHLSRAIKRKLGGSPITVSDRRGNAMTVAPQAIVRWILGEVLEAARKAAGANGPIEFGKITFTYPAAFTERQIAELEAALTIALGGSERTKLVRAADEATIGAIGWMQALLLGEGLERSREAFSRTLLVYDFGGGTTDISLIRTDVRPSDRGGLEMTPRPLGLAGLTRLGGEDVTEAIVEVLVEAIVARLADQGLEAFIPWNRTAQAIAEANGIGVAHPVLARTNLALMGFCDGLKTNGFFVEDDELADSVSSDPGLDDVFGDDGVSAARPGAPRRVAMRGDDLAKVRLYWRKKGAHVDAPWHSCDLGEPGELVSFLEGEVEIKLERVAGIIHPKIEGAVRRAHELAATILRRELPRGARAEVSAADLLERIDRIILTGQSSALPLVRQIFEDVFGDEFSSRIEFDPARAKNVVAEGAALIATRTSRYSEDPVNLEFLDSYLHHPIGREVSGIRGLGFEPWFWNGEQLSDTLNRDSGICLGMILDGECTVFENPGYWGFGELQSRNSGSLKGESLVTYFATIEVDPEMAEAYLEEPGTDQDDPIFVSILDAGGGRKILHAYVSPGRLDLTRDDLLQIGNEGSLVRRADELDFDGLDDLDRSAGPVLHLRVEMGD